MHEWGEDQSLPTRFRRFLDRAFPERQIHLRTKGRIQFYRLPQWSQLSLAFSAAAFSAWVCYATVSYVNHEQVVVAKESQISDARRAYDELLRDVAAYQNRFAELTRELEDNHNLMLGLVERNATLQRSLSTVEKRLRHTESERESVALARENLKGKLAMLEDEMRALSSKNYSLRDDLQSVETDLESVVRERDVARIRNQQLGSQVTVLERQLLSLQEAQDTAVEKMTERTMAYIESLEKVVEIAGIDAGRLLASSESKIPEGQGGPFIPIKPDAPGGQLMDKLNKLDNHLDQWQTLQSVMQRLPLSAPMNTYYITSSFGKRRDPVNNRWSAHYGVDFGGPIKSPVYTPAPGVVVYAGTKGRYGRYVEIDHGSGIITRYGHLNRITVKTGQKVGFRQQVGELGNSGRSTGPHLHYEIVFNGKPKDPMRFIKAGRHVFQG